MTKRALYFNFGDAALNRSLVCLSNKDDYYRVPPILQRLCPAGIAEATALRILIFYCCRGITRMSGMDYSVNVQNCQARFAPLLSYLFAVSDGSDPNREEGR